MPQTKQHQPSHALLLSDSRLPEASGQCPVRKSGDKAANPLYDNIIRQL